MESGKTEAKTVYEKQAVFWFRKYFLKSRAERAEILAKAEALIADPKKFNKATSYGAAAYVSNLEYDKKTGEILDKGKSLALDTVKIVEEEKYDGYYAIEQNTVHGRAGKHLPVWIPKRRIGCTRQCVWDGFYEEKASSLKNQKNPGRYESGRT